MAPSPPFDTREASFDTGRALLRASENSFDQVDTDYIDHWWSPAQSSFGNFAYSPKIKYAWVALILSCIIDRAFPNSASPLPKRLSQRLTHLKLAIVCAYPLAAAAHVLSYNKEIKGGDLVRTGSVPYMDALVVVRLFYLLGGILAASWTFGWRKQLDLLGISWTLPFPVFLAATVAFPITASSLFGFRSGWAADEEPSFVDMLEVAGQSLVLLYSLHGYVRSGLFARPHRRQLFVFLALSASWLCMLALSGFVEYNFWDTLLRRGTYSGPEPSSTCTPFASLPAFVQPCLSQIRAYWVELPPSSGPVEAYWTDRFEMTFKVPVFWVFPRNVWQEYRYGTWLVYSMKFSKPPRFEDWHTWRYDIGDVACFTIFVVAVLGVTARWTGLTWLQAAYKLAKHDALDDIWAVVWGCGALVVLDVYLVFVPLWLMGMDWLTKVMVVFYKLDAYFPPQYARFNETLLFQLGVEWLAKAIFALSVFEAGCRARSWFLSVVDYWKGKKQEVVKKEEDTKFLI